MGSPRPSVDPRSARTPRAHTRHHDFARAAGLGCADHPARADHPTSATDTTGTGLGCTDYAPCAACATGSARTWLGCTDYSTRTQHPTSATGTTGTTVADPRIPLRNSSVGTGDHRPGSAATTCHSTGASRDNDATGLGRLGHSATQSGHTTRPPRFHRPAAEHRGRPTLAALRGRRRLGDAVHPQPHVSPPPAACRRGPARSRRPTPSRLRNRHHRPEGWHG